MASPIVNKKIGIIGAGVMGGALCKGLINAGASEAGHLTLSDPHSAHLNARTDALGVNAAPDNASIARSSDIVVLAVKPQTIPGVLIEIGDILQPQQLLISIAAGFRISSIEGAVVNPV